jgi:hypothetical protein
LTRLPPPPEELNAVETEEDGCPLALKRSRPDDDEPQCQVPHELRPPLLPLDERRRHGSLCAGAGAAACGRAAAGLAVVDAAG